MLRNVYGIVQHLAFSTRLSNQTPKLLHQIAIQITSFQIKSSTLHRDLDLPITVYHTIGLPPWFWRFTLNLLMSLRHMIHAQCKTDRVN